MGSWDRIVKLGQGSPGPQTLSPRPGSGLPEKPVCGFKPEHLRTPKEALAYIAYLYRNGRTAELAGLLRRLPVFREAWLALQIFPQILPGAGGVQKSPKPTQAAATLCPGSAPPAPARPLESFPSVEPQNLTGSTLKDMCSPKSFWALSVYQLQEQYFTKDRAALPGIDLRV